MQSEAAAPGRPASVVVMGVSGAGKSTVGALLADLLGWPFIDADDLHPPVNLANMSAGIALTDEDRWPWLDEVGRQLAARPCVVACSALRRSYRDRLRRSCPGFGLVYLAGERARISARQAGRQGHFMPSNLMTSQFSLLEPPESSEHALILDVVSLPAELAARAAQWCRDH